MSLKLHPISVLKWERFAADGRGEEEAAAAVSLRCFPSIGNGKGGWGVRFFTVNLGIMSIA